MWLICCADLSKHIKEGITMDHRTVYMLIRELSDEKARKYLMTDAEFAMLPPDEQLNEVNRAVNAAHIDRSLLHMAYSSSGTYTMNTRSMLSGVGMMFSFAESLYTSPWKVMRLYALCSISGSQILIKKR